MLKLTEKQKQYCSKNDTRYVSSKSSKSEKSEGSWINFNVRKQKDEPVNKLSDFSARRYLVVDRGPAVRGTQEDPFERSP